MAQKNLGIDVIIDHVIGILNGFADAVSRGVLSITLDTQLNQDFATKKLLLLVYRSIYQ